MYEPRNALPSSIMSYTYAQLRERLRPQSLEAPEALPFVLFDTQTYLAAGTTGHLDFFRNVNADPTLSNLEIAGSLPDGVFFDIHRIFVTPLRQVSNDAAASGITGVVRDIQTILNIARGTFTFTQNQKPLGPIPLRFFGDGGQASGLLAAATTVAASQIQLQVGAFPQNGGYPVNGSIRLGPAAKFGASMDFVPTAVTVDTPLQVALLGILYRKIG